jgi:Cu2+-exporting ATPase
MTPQNENLIVVKAEGTRSFLARLTAFEETHINPLFDQIYQHCTMWLQACLPKATTQSRQSQLARLMTMAEEELSQEEEIAANRRLVWSGVALGLSSLGKFLFPPLLLLSIPPLLRITVPLMQDAYEQWWRQHKVGTTVLDSVVIIGMLTTGAIWSAALMEVLFSCNQKIQAKTRSKMKTDLFNMMGEMPRVVWIKKDGVEVSVPIDEIEQKDTVLVHTGEIIPADGLITGGVALIDQHMLTGEAQPAEKGNGDTVYAGTIVLAGSIELQVEKAGAETVIGQVGEILHNTIDHHTALELRGQTIADRSVVPSLLLGALIGATLGPAQATAALGCSIGYQMKYTGPISVLSFLELATKAGALIKDGRALEQLILVDTVVFDKTGTLTEAQPHLAEIYPQPGFTKEQVLCLAASAEAKQSHPISQAIRAAAAQAQMTIPAPDSAAYEIGYGIRVTIQQAEVCIGSARFMQREAIALPANISYLQERCYAAGHTVVYLAVDRRLAGIIELHATIRPEAEQVIHTLKARGLSLYIISGDHELPTRRLAQELGIDHYFAEVLPEHKADLVTALQQEGRTVCFIGDGINDSIALKRADVSISLHGATTIALDTAQIILRDQSLSALMPLFDLADQFQNNMQVNLLASTVPGIINTIGVCLSMWGLSTALLFTWSGLSLGTLNAIAPVLTNRSLFFTDHRKK